MLVRFMYVKNLYSRRQQIVCALLLLQKATSVRSYAVLYAFQCQSKVVALVFTFLLHFCVVIFILLKLFSSWICMTWLRLDVKQTIINKPYQGLTIFLRGKDFLFSWRKIAKKCRWYNIHTQGCRQSHSLFIFEEKLSQ